jgi:hypothetical protein
MYAVQHDAGSGSARELVESMLRPVESRTILENVLHHPWVTTDASGSFHQVSPYAFHAKPSPAPSPSPFHSPAGPQGCDVRSSFTGAVISEYDWKPSMPSALEATGIEHGERSHEVSQGRSQKTRSSNVGANVSLHARTDPLLDAESLSAHTQMHMQRAHEYAPRVAAGFNDGADGTGVMEAKFAVDVGEGKSLFPSWKLLEVPLQDRKILQQDIADLVRVSTEPARAPMQPQ